MDHTDRFLSLSLAAPDLAAPHVLAAYILKPADGHDFLQTVASFAAESGRGTQVPLPMMADALIRAPGKTGTAKIFSMSISADDLNEIDMRAEAALPAFKPPPDSLAFHVDTSYLAGPMGFGPMEGNEADRPIACMIAQNIAQGPYFEQNWYGLKRSAAIASGGINAPRLPSFLQNLGHSNFILAADGGAFGHIDGPLAGACYLRQAEACWLARADPFDFAANHKEFARAFLSFEQDADIIHPGWRAALSQA